MGIISALGAGIGAIVSGISSICSKIGGTIGYLGGKVIEKIFPAVLKVDIAIRVVTAIGKILKTVAEEFGIIEKDDEPEELVAKAMQPEAKKSDEFDSYNDYINYLKNEIELDKEKFNKLSKKEILAYKADGIVMISKGLEEKTGIKLPVEFLCDINKRNISSNELINLLKEFKTEGLSDLGMISDYLNGKNIGKYTNKVSSAIENALKNTYPEMSQEQIDKKIVDLSKESEYSYV